MGQCNKRRALIGHTLLIVEEKRDGGVGPEYPMKNHSKQGQEPTTNSTHMIPSLGIEPSLNMYF